jgi:hypothetical protein
MKFWWHRYNCKYSGSLEGGGKGEVMNEPVSVGQSGVREDGLCVLAEGSWTVGDHWNGWLWQVRWKRFRKSLEANFRTVLTFWLRLLSPAHDRQRIYQARQVVTKSPCPSFLPYPICLSEHPLPNSWLYSYLSTYSWCLSFFILVPYHHSLFKPYAANEWAALPFCIGEVPSTILGPEAACPD